MAKVVRKVRILMKGYIFKIKSIGFADGLDLGCETRRGVLTDTIHQDFELCRSKGQVKSLRVNSPCVNFHSPATLLGISQSTNLLVIP